MKIDLHIHSNYSFDSKMSVKSIANYALNRGVKYIALTDHVEFKYDNIDKVLKRLEIRQKEIDDYNKYMDGLKILSAVEIGSPHLYPNNVNKLVENISFDFTLGSIHQLSGCSMRKLLNDGVSYKIIEKMYLEEMGALVEDNNIDVVAHFDYFKRYTGIEYFDKEILEPIIKKIIDTKKALEINTSARRRNQFESFPNSDIIELYKKLGGKCITVGSDAHDYSELFDDIDNIDDMIKSMEFNKIIIEKRKIKVI